MLPVQGVWLAHLYEPAGESDDLVGTVDDLASQSNELAAAVGRPVEGGVQTDRAGRTGTQHALVGRLLSLRQRRLTVKQTTNRYRTQAPTCIHVERLDPQAELSAACCCCASSWGCCYQIFKVLRLCRFSTDRYETFHSLRGSGSNGDSLSQWR